MDYFSVVQYEYELNDWVSCEGVNPNLPEDTVVKVIYRNGVKDGPYKSRLHVWGVKPITSKEDLSRYDIISYRILKV